MTINQSPTRSNPSFEEDFVEASFVKYLNEWEAALNGSRPLLAEAWRTLSGRMAESHGKYYPAITERYNHIVKRHHAYESDIPTWMQDHAIELD
jgi:hypothetical protein